MADLFCSNALAESLKFGVKTLAMGSVVKDYHTTQVPPQDKKAKHWHTRGDELRVEKTRLGTILSSREYRQDGLWLAAAWSDGEKPAYALDDLAGHLARPAFTLYLGRKSCPLALPLNPHVIQAETLKAAFAAYPTPVLPLPLGEGWGEGNTFKRLPTAYAWESCDHSGMRETLRTPCYDDPLSRTRWQFASREEHVFLGEGA
ncbi:type I-E CRISPR-associated protein Cas5/CasD [Methylococcus sp. Mc7]|uniref:type I-E CRISPR-associated protein Cas5/CasD n=1 Tax=Methylococcus sp. Mc7 TaxID=2860258 RepID=UPI001C52E2C5|nr:type I-E CRISPR-associated protein Cas5/CasD [Methylococcus sp. Mc7]QXP84558.1 type I-E CRISPR-associated protein Cas5/CasD [Methylococcus sp. Mc7]